MKRIITLILAIVMSISTVSAFSTTRVYAPGQFTDVPADAWCADNVKIVYESNVMNGVSDDCFGVNGTMTVAQAMVIACRLHADQYDKEIDVQEGASPWYQPYADYAKKNNLWASDTANYAEPVRRGDFVTILSMALPDSCFVVMNNIEDKSIPDIAEDAGYAKHVYRFYRAGILTGNDAKGTFAPDSTITRGAAAAIISRILDTSLRKSITLTKPPFEAVPMTQLANYASLKKKMSDDEFRQAYDAALKIITPLAEMSKQNQLQGVYAALRYMAEYELSYSTDVPHYNDPYGYFVNKVASCAGSARATGLCLNMLGIPYEHVNENKWLHQWCRVDMGDGTYWICDPYGMYVGAEPYVYGHPYF